MAAHHNSRVRSNTSFVKCKFFRGTNGINVRKLRKVCANADENPQPRKRG